MRFVSAFALFTAFTALSALTMAQDKEKDKPTPVTVIGKLKATPPADWKKEKPANLLRAFQFRLPEVKDLPGAEIVGFPEGNPNADKKFPEWKAQFLPPEGKTIDDIAKTSKWEVKGATVTVLDIAGGTWKFKERPKDPSSKEFMLENYRVVWVIVAQDDDATHIRMSGPIPSVEKYYKGFEEWVKALK